MQLLLDTHVYLWAVTNSPQLNPRAAALLQGDHELFLSVASLWEIVIKTSVGKLQVDVPLETLMEQYLTLQHITLQDITVDALLILATLPLHHRDPFDRLLIAQALDAQVAIVSADTAFDAYAVQRLW